MRRGNSEIETPKYTRMKQRLCEEAARVCPFADSLVNVSDVNYVGNFTLDFQPPECEK